jgi:hypothetical protein
VNHTRGRRIWHEEAPGAGARRRRAERPNHVWALDFISDPTRRASQASAAHRPRSTASKAATPPVSTSTLEAPLADLYAAVNRAGPEAAHRPPAPHSSNVGVQTSGWPDVSSSNLFRPLPRRQALPWPDSRVWERFPEAQVSARAETLG